MSPRFNLAQCASQFRYNLTFPSCSAGITTEILTPNANRWGIYVGAIISAFFLTPGSDRGGSMGYFVSAQGGDSSRFVLVGSDWLPLIQDSWWVRLNAGSNPIIVIEMLYVPTG